MDLDAGAVVFVRQLWSQPNRTRAFGFLADWIALARISGIIMLERFADTLEAHEEGILAYYNCPISTGPPLWYQQQIKTMKRQACGFRVESF